MIFTFSPTGGPVTPTTLYSFQNDANGSFPYSLVQGVDGKLYGTTQFGGGSGCGGFGCGTIFSLSIAGCLNADPSCLSTLYQFQGGVAGANVRKAQQPNARQPGPARIIHQCPPQHVCSVSEAGPGFLYNKALVQDSDGDLYGTTPPLDNSPGTVFRFSPTKTTLSTLYSFSTDGGTDGGGSYFGLFLGSDQNLYGLSGDVFFNVASPLGASTIFNALYTFTGGPDGGTPFAVMQASDGNLYGAAASGGSSSNCLATGCGTLFEFKNSPALAAPVQLSLSSSSSVVGAPVTLSWSVLNSFSATLQQCYAFVQGGSTGAGNWAGLQTGAVTNGVFVGSTSITPTAPGRYTYALTCGGQESGFATLTVPPLLITTPTLPHGLVGAMYSSALTASNGIPPYTWSVISGALPPGISLRSSTGLLFGIPNQIGTADFTVQVIDSEGTPATANANFALIVEGAGATLSTNLLTFQEAGGLTSVAQAVTLTNPGDLPLTVNSISVSGNFTETNNCGASVGAGTSCTISVTYQPTGPGTQAGVLTIVDNAGGSPQTVVLSGTETALQFVPIPPCRIVDTRNAVGPFGGPPLAPKQSRSFAVPESACGVPSTAAAYALNITVVPEGPLYFLSAWPTGQAQPNVSLLNSLDGRIKANATILPAGASGSISLYPDAETPTQLVIDISGYFLPATGASLQFFPITPCRVADTRNADGPFGGPALVGGQIRTFAVQESDCQVPAGAQAYSLNVTAIPDGPLGYLTIWPTGQAQPSVSTLNSPTGTVTANAAIVPAGSGGQVSLFVTDDANLVVDVNGYFAPPATGGTSLYTLAPCRVLDTRDYPFPPFPGTYTLSVQSSDCQVSTTAAAYVLNATVVPVGSLGYLSLWPAGASQPVVSTLNAEDGTITSNMAIVPTNNGAIDAYAPATTQLILDISSFFAP